MSQNELDEQQFYELMQNFRHTPAIEQEATVQAFERVQAFVADIIARKEREARETELEMFQKIPIRDMSKSVASHISRRYKALSNTPDDQHPTFEDWYAKTRDYGGTREEYDKLYPPADKEAK